MINYGTLANATGKYLSGLKRITDEELTFKQSLVDLYKNETKPINTYWAQMIPYETGLRQQTTLQENNK